MGQEFIKIKFDTDKDDIVHVTLDYEMDEVPLDIMIQALYDLARSEEKSWRDWCRKKEMEDNAYERRN